MFVLLLHLRSFTLGPLGINVGLLSFNALTFIYLVLSLRDELRRLRHVCVWNFNTKNLCIVYKPQFNHGL